MNTVIDATMKLVDRFTPTVTKIDRSLKQHEQIQKRTSKAVKSLGASFSSIKSSITGLIGPFAAFGAAMAGINGLSNFASESIRLADAQNLAETQLEAVLGNVESIVSKGSGAVQAAKKDLMDYASQLQQTGVIGDEVTLSGMKQLATFQLNNDQIKVLSGGMLDLLANTKGLKATQEDAAGVANMIGKAMQGNASALSRVGITMSEAQINAIKYGDANKRAAVIAEVLKQNVGGVNQALAQTEAGKAQQRANAYGDQMELVGEKLKKVKASLAVFTFPIKMAAMDAIMSLLSSLESALPYLESAGNAIKSFGSTLMEVAEYLKPLAPLLLSVGSAFAYLKIAESAGAGFAAFSKGIEVAKVALNGFKLSFIQTTIAMATNPITLTIIAIGALAAGLIYLYKNSESFRNGVNSLGAKLQELGQRLMTMLQPAIDKLKAAWERLTAALAVVGEKIMGLLAKMQPVIDFIMDVWVTGILFMADIVIDNFTMVLEIATTVFSGIITVASGLIDFIVGVFTGNWSQAWEGIKTIFGGIFDTITGIFDSFYNRIMAGIDSIISAAKKLPFIGGGDADGHWTGTSYFSGGLTAVNERGGELMNLPTGTQIIPHDKSLEQMYQKGLAANPGKASNNTSITIPKLADSIVIREDADIDRITNQLVFKMKQVAMNSMEGALV